MPGWFLGLLVLVNLAALFFAWQDRSWGAVAIAIMVGPIANGIFAIVGLSMIPYLRKHGSPHSVRMHVLFALGTPVLAAGFDFVAIMAMKPGGC